MIDKRSVRKAQHRIIAIEFLGDLGATAFALVAAYAMRFKTFLVNFGTAPSASQQIENYYPLLAIAILFFMFTFAYLGLYSNQHILRLHRNISSIVKGGTFWLFMFLALSLAIRFEPQVSRMFVGLSYISVISYMIAWRWILHKILIRTSIIHDLQQKVVLFGYNETALNIYKALNNDRNLPYQALGYITTDASGEVEEGTSIFGSEEDLANILEANPINMLIIAEENVSSERMVEITDICERNLVSYKIIPGSFEVFLSRLQLQNISGIPVLGVETLLLDKLGNRILKRVIDIIGSLIGLLFSIPMMFVLGILIKLESKGPIFYKQTRTGIGGKTFSIYKLRSMRTDAEKNGAQWAEENDPRKTKVGNFIRRTNLDEIPQFWNVFRGQMSLVGPRPERPELIEKFKYQIKHYQSRHFIKPGLSGWAQIHGLRGNTSLQERIQHDIFYIENWSFWLDFYIMVMTFFNRKNAY